MKKIVRVVKSISNYVKYDLREIVWPSSMPNPPGYKPKPKFTSNQWWEIAKEGTAGYLGTWKSDLPPATKKKEEEEVTMMDELAITAKSSASLQPVMMRLYQKNMAAYQQAVTNFIQGYREGAAEKVDLSDLFSSLGATDHPIAGAPSPGNPTTSEAVTAAPLRPKREMGVSGGGGQQQTLVTAEERGVSEGSGPLAHEEPLASPEARAGDAEQAAGALAESSKADILSRADSKSQDGRLEAKEGEGVASADTPLGSDEQTALETADTWKLSTNKQGQLENLVAGFPGRGAGESGGGEGEPAVAQALDEAERLAAGFLSGKVTAAQRRELELAIQRAETAMKRGAHASKSETRSSGTSTGFGGGKADKGVE